MNYTEDINKMIKAIESKKLKKRLLNEFIYLRWGIIIGIFLIVCIFFLLTCSLFDKSNNYTNYIPIFAIVCFVIFFKLVYNIENKNFYDYESYLRQFYILYLMHEIYNDNNIKSQKKKQQLWSLSRYYLRELSRTINYIRNFHMFSITSEENEIKKLKEYFKDKIMGHLIADNYDKVVSQIIEELIEININMNPNKNIDNISEVNKNNENLYNNITQLLEKVEVKNSELPIFGLSKKLSNIKNNRIKIIIIILITILITALYVYFDKSKTGDFSITTVFTIIIGTPIVVDLIYRIHKE